MKPKLLSAVLALLTAALSLPAAPTTISVDVAKPGPNVSPMLWGVFFEDINCYLDDQLIHDVTTDTHKSAFFASATRQNSTGDLILKLVNVAPTPQEATVSLNGATALSKTATAPP